ncbi:MAG: hypothetical protein ACKV2Q_09140 [Planctomycetaceae bacterium]
MSALNRGIVAWLLAVAVVVGTHGSASAQAPGRGAARPEVRGVVKSVDATAGMITVWLSDGRGGGGGGGGGGERTAAVERSYPVSKTAEVVVGGGLGRGGFSAAKEAKLNDLTAGVTVILSLTADQAVVEGVVAEGPTVRGQLKAVDAGKNSLTISVAGASREQPTEDNIYTLVSGAEIAIDDGRGRRFSIKEGKLADIAAGAMVTLRLSLDQKQAVSVQAEGPTVFGIVKSFDLSKNLLTLSLGPGRDGVGGGERIFEMASDATVLLDDGKGRRLSIKEGKLSDIPVGTAANLRLTANQRFATLLRAEGPSLGALMKAVDSANGTVTVATRVGRGENPEEKTLSVAKDARIVIDGNEGTLADIKVSDNGPFVMLRLSLDQKSVQSIQTGSGR